MVKFPPVKKILLMPQEVKECREEVNQAFKDKLPIVYIDETMFTGRVYAQQDYWVKGKAIEVDQSDVYIKYVAALAAVSGDNGLDHLRTYNHPVDSVIFADFIDELSKKRGRKPFALFMDQASFHKPDCVKEVMAKYQVRRIFNVTYSP
jgi:hypothetical protein